MKKTLKKTVQGYNYKYVDLAGVHEYLESINKSYYQYIEPIEGVDYVWTVILDKDGKEERRVQGCRVVEARLEGKSNPAQEQGSALTYARRYSLLMAFGLATEDDDGESLSRKVVKTTPSKVGIQTGVKMASERQMFVVKKLAKEKGFELKDSYTSAEAGKIISKYYSENGK